LPGNLDQDAAQEDAMRNELQPSKAESRSHAGIQQVICVGEGRHNTVHQGLENHIGRAQLHEQHHEEAMVANLLEANATHLMVLNQRSQHNAQHLV